MTVANRNLPVSGIDELQRFLEALPANLRRNAINSGLRAGAKVLVSEIRTLAPKDSGAMARSWGYSSPTRNQDGSISIRVRPKGRHAFLASFMEYGVLPHLISISDEDAAGVESRLRPGKRPRARSTVVRSANTMAKEGSLKIGEIFVGPVVHHPGFAPHPFIRPAIDAKAGAMVEAFMAQVAAWAQGKLAPALDEAA